MFFNNSHAMLLDSRDEPCIIDDTPQFSESAGITINTRSRAPGIRADAAQTALLKKAYEQSNVLSSMQAKILGDEIGLSPKWIMQWFSRQRSKERKNDSNYKPRPKTFILNNASTIGSKQSSNPAAFSAAFFSDSDSGAPPTADDISAQEIMTIKLEHQDLSLASTPSVSGSTSIEEFTPFSVSESSSSVSGHLDMIDYEDAVIKISGTGGDEGSTGRKNQNPGRRLKHALDATAQTKSTDGASFQLLKFHWADTTDGLKVSDDAQPGVMEPDIDAYTQPSSHLTSQERRVSTSSAPQLPHIVPPRRSPIITADIAVRSTGREIKTRNRPSRLSIVNVPMNDSDISLHHGNSFSVQSTINSTAETPSRENLAFSVSQTQWYNNRFSMGVPQSTVTAPKVQIVEPVLFSKYLVPGSGNCLSIANPPAAVAPSFPDFVELAFMDRLTETVHANFPDVLSPFQGNGLTWMRPPPPERYGRQPGIGVQPSGYYPSAVNPDHLEALDPLRAPLKHLTGILTEYRDEDGTYLSLLVGLQDPAGRRKIIGCLSNEELASHDPFSAAMGLSLLSRLGVL